MNNILTFGTFGGLVPLALVAGIAYAFILYRKNRIEEMPLWQHIVSAIARALVVFFIALLLFKPMVRSISSTVEKPIVILAHDNSISIADNKDSLFYRHEWTEKWNALGEDLSEKYQVRSLLFGDEVSDGLSPDFSEYYTDLSGLSSDLTRRFSGRKIAAVVIASDGIVNRGLDPIWAYKLDAPVFAIALGDTIPVRDRFIHNIFSNEFAYLGNQFPVEVEVGAELLKDQPFSVALFLNGKKIESQTVMPDKDHFFHTLSFYATAVNAGIQHYSVRISAADGEENTINNRTDFYIDVLDSQKKILLLASSLSPDVSALRQAISSLNSYQLDFYDHDEITNVDVRDYDMAILYGLPEKSTLTALKDENMPLFVVYTEGTNQVGFNELQSGIELSSSNTEYNRAVPLINSDFSAFSLPNGLEDILDKLSPLSAPFASYNVSGATHIALYQKIGEIPSEMPLLAVSKGLESRMCVIFGEGIWKWRIATARINGSTAVFDDLIGRMLQFLSIAKEKKYLHIQVEKQFYENENVLIQGEVYDDNYELINTPELTIVLTNELGNKYPFSMVQTDDVYRLDAGSLTPGRYSFIASVNRDGDIIQSSGAFVVLALNAEKSNHVANHALLFQLANKTNGELFYPINLDSLKDQLLNDENVKPVVHSREYFKELINDFRFFLLIILLLSLEWFLRRFAGSY